MKRLFTIALIVVLLALQLACSFSRGIERSSHRSHNRSSSHFERTTETRLFTYEVGESMRHIDLDVEMKLDEGAVEWHVVDPEGEVRWEHRVDTHRRVHEGCNLQPVTGEWYIEVEMHDAAGEYTFVWDAE